MAKAKEIFGLDCGAEARAGIRLVLLSRLEEMSAFRAAAIDQGSIEGVHDMRVASRRLRSALGDFLPYLRKRKLLGSKDDLKRVADALGRVRKTSRSPAPTSVPQSRPSISFALAKGQSQIPNLKFQIFSKVSLQSKASSNMSRFFSAAQISLSQLFAPASRMRTSRPVRSMSKPLTLPS